MIKLKTKAGKALRAFCAFLAVVVIDRFREVMKLLLDIKGTAIEPMFFTNGELQERLELEDDFILEIVNKGKVLYERK